MRQGKLWTVLSMESGKHDDPLGLAATDEVDVGTGEQEPGEKPASHEGIVGPQLRHNRRLDGDANRERWLLNHGMALLPAHRKRLARCIPLQVNLEEGVAARQRGPSLVRRHSRPDDISSDLAREAGRHALEAPIESMDMAILEACAGGAEVQAMAARARALVEREFDWEALGARVAGALRDRGLG